MKTLKWFNLAEYANLGDLKKAYKALVYIHHPDHNGDLENMKEINIEYEYAFEWVKNHPRQESDTYANKHHNIEDGFREVIINVVFIPNIDIEICGSWIWIDGVERDNKAVQKILKSTGFEWASGKRKWYWKPSDYVKKGRTKWSMERIRNTYGSHKVENETRTQVG